VPTVKHFAPLQPPTGGIATVVSTLVDQARGSDQRWQYVSHNTYGSRPILATLRVIAWALATRFRRLDFDVAHLHVSHGLSVVRKAIVATAIGKRRPIVMQLHSGTLLVPGVRSRWELAFWDFLTRRADVVLCLNREVESHVLARLAGSRGAPTTEVIANCVAVPQNIEATEAAGRTTLVFLGRLGTRKGVDTLLDAFALLDSPTTTLLMCGDGDIQPWAAQAERLGISASVTFTGWVDKRQGWSYLKSATALILPARAEGLPMSVLEALGVGVPVIVTPVGGIPDYLVDGRDALIIPAEDPRALADSMRRVICDPELAAALSRGGLITYAQNFDPAILIDRLSDLYSAVESRRSADRCAT
jgi:glycosyltransferase involved in cell wall biosynthesis